MAKSDRPRGRPADPSKVPIYCRIDQQAVDALDGIADGMDPKPSRAQLIDRAVREFVERHGKARSK